MPFINGRYHMNPAVGQALEDARNAAEELLASQDGSHSTSDDDFADDQKGLPGRRLVEPGRSGPIHHVEIDAAEVVPSHTGRATHGFVARIRRAPSDQSSASVEPSAATLRPETHVFTDHRDLVDFLRSELANDCARS